MCETNKRPFFLPKINKVFISPILQHLKRRSVLDKLFLKMIVSTGRKRCRQAKSSIFSGSRSKTQNGYQNRIYPSRTLQSPDCKIFPFKKVFKKLPESKYKPYNDHNCWINPITFYIDIIIYTHEIKWHIYGMILLWSLSLNGLKARYC